MGKPRHREANLPKITLLVRVKAVLAPILGYCWNQMRQCTRSWWIPCSVLFQESSLNRVLSL